MADIGFPSLALRRHLPNGFDLIAIVCLLGGAAALAHGAHGALAPLSALHTAPIALDPRRLPGYALRTTLRMFAALLLSLLFTFTYAPWAAKSRRAGLVLVPLLDILQSVPILGFLSFTVLFFMGLFPGRVLGAEAAAIFAIFTSQAWNMAFSLHQSLLGVPSDLDEAATAFRLSGWQRFWRLEAPFAMPGLVWNTMMSMSAGWFFVVASEAVSVGDVNWRLPGIGSYLATALERRDARAVGCAIGAMLVVILLYDQLLFRPLVAWSDKFRAELVAGPEAPDPWVLALLRRTRLLRHAVRRAAELFFWLSGRPWRWRRHPPMPLRARAAPAPGIGRAAGDAVFFLALAVATAAALAEIVRLAAATLGWADLRRAVMLGCFTLARVAVLMVAASVVWVPAGVWLGLRPAWARRAQPLAQFLAAFPANLFFPVFVAAIVRWRLNPDIWLTPLMILGNQWYILFNVVAGAAAFPGDLREASASFRVGGWLWWRRVMLPGILPYYLTGAITAAGGAWNAAIVAEVANWGHARLVAHGLGAYIAAASDAGSTPRIVLGVSVMAGFVILTNRLLWRPLYALSSRRAGAA